MMEMGMGVTQEARRDGSFQPPVGRGCKGRIARTGNGARQIGITRKQKAAENFRGLKKINGFVAGLLGFLFLLFGLRRLFSFFSL
jgi:hypothetical protein